MEFKKADFNAFRADVSEALKAVAEKHQVKIECGNISYSDIDFTMKMKVTKSNIAGDSQHILFDRYCKSYGFEPTDYNRIFYIKGKAYKLVGFNIKSPKNCCSIVQLGTNTAYKCPASTVKAGFMKS